MVNIKVIPVAFVFRVQKNYRQTKKLIILQIESRLILAYIREYKNYHLDINISTKIPDRDFDQIRISNSVPYI